MRNHPVWLDFWFLDGPFVYFHTSCVRTAKAMARLRGCTSSPEPSLVAFVISTIISWAGSNASAWLVLWCYGIAFFSDNCVSQSQQREATAENNNERLLNELCCQRRTKNQFLLQHKRLGKIFCRFMIYLGELAGIIGKLLVARESVVV